MYLNAFKTKVLMEKLEKNKWTKEEGGFIFFHSKDIYGDQYIKIDKNKIYIGPREYEIIKWVKLIDFIELRVKVIFKAPMIYME
jgi:hypothetical protein